MYRRTTSVPACEGMPRNDGIEAQSTYPTCVHSLSHTPRFNPSPSIWPDLAHGKQYTTNPITLLLQHLPWLLLLQQRAESAP